MSSFKKVPLIRDQSPSELKRFALIGFAVFVLLNGINVYGEAKGFYRQARPLALQGATELQKGAHALKNQNFLEAQSQFKAAQISLKALEEASRSLTAQAYDFLGQGLAAGTVEAFIEMGQEASGLGQDFAAALEAWKKDPQKIPLNFLRESQASVESLRRQTGSLKKKIQAILKLPLPGEIRVKLQKIEPELALFNLFLSEGEIVLKAALRLLGDKSPHHFLILFQNRNERRATGGFIGSFLLMTVNEGKITKLEPKDVYESDGQLSVTLPPPPGIAEVAETWGLRDANYSPDFPTSAKKIRWFLEKSRGPSVDTVIAVDQTVAEKLLELTGPIELPGFPFTFKPKNLDNILSFIIEAKLSGAAPKQLLFDLLTALRNEIKNIKDIAAVQNNIKNLIENGHIQLYSEDPIVQALAETWKMDGRMMTPLPRTDFLAVISTSIGGNKSDRFIKMDLNHQTFIADDGSMADELVIQKTHTWQPGDFLRWKRYLDYYGPGKLSEKSLRFILGESPNVDYLRVYVPFGSQLEGVEGVKEVAQTDDLGYTVFAVPMTVKPGENEALTLRYELPFKLLQHPVDDYRLIRQPQAGAKQIAFSHETIAADPFKIARNLSEGDRLFLSTIKK